MSFEIEFKWVRLIVINPVTYVKANVSFLEFYSFYNFWEVWNTSYIGFASVTDRLKQLLKLSINDTTTHRPYVLYP